MLAITTQLLGVWEPVAGEAINAQIPPLQLAVGPHLARLSEDPGPHGAFFSCVRRAGRGVGYPGWLSSSSTSIPHIRLVSHT